LCAGTVKWNALSICVSEMTHKLMNSLRRAVGKLLVLCNKFYVSSKNSGKESEAMSTWPSKWVRDLFAFRVVWNIDA
jgi:hypothetical protein